MNNRQVLPALRPVPNGAAAFPGTRDDSKRIISLINKALVSTSLKEKNGLLEEMNTLWIPQNDELDNVVTSNFAKQAEFDRITKRLGEVQNQHDLLKKNTSFHKDKYADKLSRLKNKSISDIVEIEQQITKLTSSPSPPLDTSPEKSIYSYLDVKFRRLEELSYAYKKRLLIVEQSQESTEMVLREFGSVNGLLEKTKLLTEENHDLRKAEINYIEDSLTRRRKLSNISPSIVRNLTICISQAIKTHQITLESLNSGGFKTLSDNSEKYDFDKLCSDSNFSLEPSRFDIGEFANNTEPELLDALASSSSGRDTLVLLRQFCQQSVIANRKLEAEILSCREKHRGRIETGQSRADKLVEDNIRLFEGIEKAQSVFDKNSEDVNSLSSSLNKILHEKAIYEGEIVSIVSKLRTISSDHSDAYRKLIQNRNCLRTLVNTCSVAARFLIGLGKQPVDQYVADQIVEDSSKLLQESVRIEDDADIPQTPSILDMSNIMNRSNAPRGRNRNRKHVKKGQEEEIVKTEEIHEYSKVEILHILCKMMDLGGFVLGTDIRYNQMFTEFFKGIIDDVSSVERREVIGFGKNMSEAFTQLRMINGRILVKEKAAALTQTEEEPKTEEETQTTESGIVKAKKKM